MRIDQLRKRPDLIRMMSAADQQRYAPQLGDPGYHPPEDHHPPMKSDKAERAEQGHFANWLLLQRGEGRKLPFVWHSTAARSRATPGCPDFLVGTYSGWLSIEFKRDYSCHLSEDQAQFQADCTGKALPFYIVYSAQEAIELVRKHDEL